MRHFDRRGALAVGASGRACAVGGDVMRGQISTDTLRAASATAQDALLLLAWAFEDAGRVDLKTDVLQVRKQLIKATTFKNGGSV